jgi:hypothetical protein
MGQTSGPDCAAFSARAGEFVAANERHSITIVTNNSSFFMGFSLCDKVTLMIVLVFSLGDNLISFTLTLMKINDLQKNNKIEPTHDAGIGRFLPHSETVLYFL